MNKPIFSEDRCHSKTCMLQRGERERERERDRERERERERLRWFMGPGSALVGFKV